MNPSIKRLVGALLLIGTLGVSSVMALNANAETPSGADYQDAPRG
ncbi:MAG: hypothetical protein AAF465_06655 [Pseudomonadota bacterium]